MLQIDQKEHFQDQIIEIEILIRGNKKNHTTKCSVVFFSFGTADRDD